MAHDNRFSFNLVRAIDVFAAIVETRHFTTAAKMLGMTQSAASQHIRNLETAMGAELINREVRPVELTKAGVALHRRAQSVLAEIEQLRVDVRRATAAPLPLLRVAMLASIATTLAPVIAAQARDEFHIPEISLFAGVSSDHQNLLRTRRADLAITSDTLFEIEGLARFPILREQYLLVTPHGYQGDLHDLEALARELPLVRFSRETRVGQRTDQHLSRLRLNLPRSLEGDRASIVMAPVAAGLGFAILTPTLLIDGLAEGMRVSVHPLPVTGFSREIFVVARERELGELPESLATLCAESLARAIGLGLPDLPAGSHELLVDNA